MSKHFSYVKAICAIGLQRAYSFQGSIGLRTPYMITSSNGNIFRVIWTFARRIHRSPVNSPHKGQWRGALMFSLICARTNGWVNNRAENSPVTGEFPLQRPVPGSSDVFFDLHPNKRLSKQSRGWWFETPSRSLWRNCYETLASRLREV